MIENGKTPSAQYSITVRLEYPNKPGWIAKITTVIGNEGGCIRAIDLVDMSRGISIRDYSIECGSSEHSKRIIEAVKKIEGVAVHSVSDNTFLAHLGGKLEIASKVPLKTRADLSMTYTPGVARVCEALVEKPASSFKLTIRKNCIAIVSDGTAVLGLGNIGPVAAMPVMEGKAILFKEFGRVDAFPLCIEAKSPGEVIDFCLKIAPTFGGINLEDIAAPACFEVEETLKKELDIPVFHDDQHGTAVVVLAGVINALKLTGKKPGQMKLVVSGAGAAGVACTRILMRFGFGDVIVCDSKGAISKKRSDLKSSVKQWLADNTNKNGTTGSLREVIKGADMFLGVSAPNLLLREDVLSMNEKPVIFAMSNPDPEINPEKLEGIDLIMATGRSDYPNQVNNVLAFPGIFRGALDTHARDINEEMKLAAAYAIAGCIPDEELCADYIIPSVFNKTVSRRVAASVAEAACETGAARKKKR